MFSNCKNEENLDTMIDHFIVWKDDIGYLPGCHLKFKRDINGELCLSNCNDDNDYDDDNNNNNDDDDDDLNSITSSSDDGNNIENNNNVEIIRKKQKLTKDYLFERKNHDQYNYQDLSLCLRCFRSEFRENLQKSQKFCKQCSQIDSQMYKIYKNFDVNLSRSKNQDLDDDKHLNITKKLQLINQQQQQQPHLQHHHQQRLRKRKLSSDFEISNEFEWEKYLEKYHLTALPSKYFTPEQSYPSMTNEFEVNMKLEGIDPLHPSKFCVLTVKEIQGHRLCLHFDGYSHRFDFWVNADSKHIFPIEFCKKTNRKLEYPPGMNKFDWQEYLSMTKSKAAPENLFTINQVSVDHSIMKKFSIDDKLEAVDIANSALICVATIRDILMDQVLIHFDGWDDSFDYWTSVRSSLIHPINWCKSKSKDLTPPNDYRKEFQWDEYLKETNSKSVPEIAFTMINEKNQQQQQQLSLFDHWKQGMRLEAVDKRNPQFIRVASIVNHNQHSVIIHYDGWDEKYDCMFDEDSPDLHPINWCKKTGHRLEIPPNKYLSKMHTLCPVPNCNGDGHIKWYKSRLHTNEKDCPYSKHNYDLERAENYDRFSDIIVSDSDDDDDNVKLDDDYNIFKNNKSSNMAPNKISINPYYSKLMKENYLEMKKILKSNNVNTLHYLMEFVKNFEYYPYDLVEFDSQKMYEVIHAITSDAKTAEIFLIEKIDGVTFLCLRHDDIVNKLKIDLNSAVKIVPYLFANLKFLFKDGF